MRLAQVVVENIGRRAGDEVVQLYVTDVVRSVSPPVQELKGSSASACGRVSDAG